MFSIQHGPFYLWKHEKLSAVNRSSQEPLSVVFMCKAQKEQSEVSPCQINQDQVPELFVFDS